ncbi:MAG: MFS transporter, partial [Myroides sp.]
LFVETNTNAKIRSSAQGLFMMMTNGFGAVIGSNVAGWAIDKYFTKSFTSATDLAAELNTTADNPTFLTILKDSFRVNIAENGVLSNEVFVKDWQGIWLTFAAYSFVVAILFALFFKHKHNPNEIKNI